jgi:hypothetical protein
MAERGFLDEFLVNFSFGSFGYITGANGANLGSYSIGSRSARQPIFEEMTDYLNIIFKDDAFDGDRRESINAYVLKLNRIIHVLRDMKKPSSRSDVINLARAEACINNLILADKVMTEFLTKVKTEFYTGAIDYTVTENE